MTLRGVAVVAISVMLTADVIIAIYFVASARRCRNRELKSYHDRIHPKLKDRYPD